jgi:hypothetical protein
MDLMQGNGVNGASGFSLSGTLAACVVVIEKYLQLGFGHSI